MARANMWNLPFRRDRLLWHESSPMLSRRGDAGSASVICMLQMVLIRHVRAGDMAGGRRILDLRCGPGIGLEYPRERGATRVVGADRDASLLWMARKGSSAFAALVRCGAALDTVPLLEGHMYFTNSVTTLREVRRMLRDGGTGLLFLPNGAELGVPPSGAIVRFYPDGQVGELLREAGFVPEVFGVFPFREGAKVKTARQLTASRLLDALERVGFPASVRTRLTSAILRKNCQLPVSIQSSHRLLLREDNPGTGLSFRAPDECRVLYACGVAA